MKIRILLLTILPTFILSACALAAASPTPTATVRPLPTATETAIPPTPTPTQTITPTNTPTATPFVPYNVVVAAHDSVNVREGPGYLFAVLRAAKPGTKLLLLGRAPGGEWFYVKVNDFVSGWVFGMLLAPDPDRQSAPIIEPTDVNLIRGRVRDSAGTPIRGVVFNVVQRGKPFNSNPVVTDSAGMFYAYFPTWAVGWWTVTHAGIACDSNVWAGTDCSSYKPEYRGDVKPPAADVRIPQTEILEFLWT
jgi:hypothetical protein